jgi:site-specific recombinase XerD
MGMSGDIKRYLNRQKTLGRSDKTLSSYEWRLQKLRDILKSQTNNKRDSFRDVTIEDIKNFQDHLQASGNSYATRRAIMATVKHFFAWLHESGKILADPAANIPLEKKREPELEMPPSETEVADMLESVQPGRYSHNLRRAILELIYGCGLRRSEVTKIRLDQIDLARSLLLIRGKGDKERIVPIPDGTMRFLDLYLASRHTTTTSTDATDILFLKESGEPINTAFIDNLFAWLRQRTKTTIHAHLLRHAFAVHLLRNGADVRVLQELLGHESIDDTARYLRLVKEDVKTAYDAAMEEILT